MEKLICVNEICTNSYKWARIGVAGEIGTPCDFCGRPMESKAAVEEFEELEKIAFELEIRKQKFLKDNYMERFKWFEPVITAKPENRNIDIIHVIDLDIFTYDKDLSVWQDLWYMLSGNKRPMQTEVRITVKVDAIKMAVKGALCVDDKMDTYVVENVDAERGVITLFALLNQGVGEVKSWDTSFSRLYITGPQTFFTDSDENIDRAN